MIEFSHVSKLFGAQKAVNDLNLNFQEGSFSVLIGTSGLRQIHHLEND